MQQIVFTRQPIQIYKDRHWYQCMSSWPDEKLRLPICEIECCSIPGVASKLPLWKRKVYFTWRYGSCNLFGRRVYMLYKWHFLYNPFPNPEISSTQPWWCKTIPIHKNKYLLLGKCTTIAILQIMYFSFNPTSTIITSHSLLFKSLLIFSI